MAIATAPLTLMTFPQYWDADTRTLSVRFLSLPSTNPLSPLAPGVPAFSDAALRYEARVIASLRRAPQAADAEPVGKALTSDRAAQKAALFQELADTIIDHASPPDDPLTPRFRKPVVDSYVKLTGQRLLSEHLATSDEFDCARHDALAGQPTRPITLPDRLRWGQALALAVRQPALSEALGLCTKATVLDVGDRFARGGWLYIGLHATSAGAAVDGLTMHYAARIPPVSLTSSRYLYAAVLVPVDATDLTLDHVDRDADDYDNGHARMVHASQWRGDEMPGPTATPGNTGDAIHLAWDDERLAEWFNRQVDPATQTPMGTAGYRVDVRLAGTENWTSLQRIRSIDDLTLGPVSLGPAPTDEGVIEVVPAQIAPNRPTEFWMPRYFTAWRGTSLVLSDPDLVSFHRDAAAPEGIADSRLGRNQAFEPVDATNVPLRYGTSYEFRVRMVDLSGGGLPPEAPLPDPTTDPDGTRVTSITFKRTTPPGAMTVVQRPSLKEPELVVARPHLAHPEILYTSSGTTFDQLKQAHQADQAAKIERSLGLPDPDVTDVTVQVEVKALTGEPIDWQRLYECTVAFPAAADLLTLGVEFLDMTTLAGPVVPDPNSRLPLPTARDVRVTLRAIGRSDDDYFATDHARVGAAVVVEFSTHARVEPDLLDTPTVRSFFLRPPPDDGSLPRPAERLAQELDLSHHDLTLTAPPGGRTVLACSAGIAHILSPERCSLAFSSDTDLTNQWINVVRFTVKRDWTWRGFAATGFVVHRRVTRVGEPAGEREVVGTISWPTAIAPDAAAGSASDSAYEPVRQSSEVVFIDAFDPKRPNEEPPTELTIEYELEANLLGAATVDPVAVAAIELPVTTPPSQVPKLHSAGIAMSPFGAADDYSSTTPRSSRLWLQFDEPPRDSDDTYCVRILAIAPDPLLVNDPFPETTPEPPLPTDPEWLRTIHPGQPHDDNGLHAMTPLVTHDDGRMTFIVPLPDGLTPASPELFSMFTYEIRLGHERRWCTAQGRFGPALRVAGVQHPAPSLPCHTARNDAFVRVSAPFAIPVHRGRPIRGREGPRTQLWALLYAQVQQADTAEWRNLLLDREPMVLPDADGPPSSLRVLYGEAQFPLENVNAHLEDAGLPIDTPLSTLAVEMYDQPTIDDPLRDNLGHGRTLRISPLVAVPARC